MWLSPLGRSLLLAFSVQMHPQGQRMGVYRVPKPPYLSEFLPGIGPRPEVGLVQAQGNRHQRVATVIEYWPVGGRGRLRCCKGLRHMFRAEIL